LFSNKVRVLRVLRGKIVIGWVGDPVIWIIKSDFPRRGIPVVGVFFAEGCDKGPRRGFGIRSGQTTDFRECEFELGVIEEESF